MIEVLLPWIKRAAMQVSTRAGLMVVARYKPQSLHQRAHL